MDEETRAGFDEMRHGLAAIREEMREGFAAVARRFDGVDQRLDAVDRRFDAVDQRFDGDTDVLDQIRRLGVMTEDLRTQIQQVAEIVHGNTQAIERVRVEMNERFRENEIIVGFAFRQIRRDIDELD